MTSITIVKLNIVLNISWPLIRLATDIIKQIKLNESLLSLFFNSENFIINNIAKLCEISKDQINIKGKTTEKLGVIGKEKAIACETICSVIKYD